MVTEAEIEEWWNDLARAIMGDEDEEEARKAYEKARLVWDID